MNVVQPVRQGSYYSNMKKGFSKKGKEFLLRRILPVGVVLAACTCGAYVVNSAQYNDHFLPGTIINGIDVSDLTLQQAEASIRKNEEAYKLTIKFRGGTEQVLSKKDLGLSYDCTNELQQLMNQQNSHAWLSRQLGAPSEVTLTSTKFSVSDEDLDEAISSLPELQEGNYEEPKEARLLLKSDGQFTVAQEEEGTKLRPEELEKVAKAAIAEGQTVLDLTSASTATAKVYEEPAQKATDKSITRRLKRLNRFLSAKVTIHMSDGSEKVVDSSITNSWVSVTKDGEYEVREDTVYRNAKALIAELAKKDDDYGYYRSFASTNYGLQKFPSEKLHGHTLNQSVMAKALTKMLMKGRTADLDPVYLQCMDVLDPHFGGTYVEVDIYNQHVYYYENNELIYDCSCVTGTEGYSSTPSGIFSVEEKIRGRNLEGYNSAGQKTYSVWVNFWICFLPHYGLHDASWRGSFGGDIYEYDGSHGCVNLSYNSASALYDLVDYDTPVIILRGEYT